MTSLPPAIGSLSSLSALNVSDNQLSSLPIELTRLTSLQSLHLHGNQLQTLPQGLVRLENLTELSLRNNPLVLRFVREWPNSVPTLLELSGRSVKKHRVPYSAQLVPTHLVHFLDSAQHCDNPSCNGVYFTSRVQRVKFMDFCGKYRLPLMQYLCTALCDDTEDSSTTYNNKAALFGHQGLGGSGGGAAANGSSSDEDADETELRQMRKVLLG